MTAESDGAPTAPALDQSAGAHQLAVAQLGCGVDDCLLVANQLRVVLGEETRALRAFDSDLLLQLITQKDALVRDLGTKLAALVRDADVDCHQADKPAGINATLTSSPIATDSESGLKRQRLREILAEIERGNEVNRILIEGSLSYGLELLELFVPGTYAVGQEGQAERLQPSTKGLALNKEA